MNSGFDGRTIWTALGLRGLQSYGSFHCSMMALITIAEPGETTWT